LVYFISFALFLFASVLVMLQSSAVAVAAVAVAGTHPVAVDGDVACCET